MTALIPFLFDDERVIRTLSQGDEPWFVLADVCAALGIENPSAAVKALDEDERAKFNLGRQGEANIVNESGLYTIILRSREATTPGTVAHRFRKWVTAEVLPTIRKTGGYRTAQARADFQGQNQAVRLMDKLKRETNPAIRQTLHAMLASILTSQGIDVPPLDAIGHEAPPPPPPPPILVEFWPAIAAIEAAGTPLDHSIDRHQIALSLSDLARGPGGRPIFPVTTQLRDTLRQSTAPAFIGIRTVRSRIAGKTVRCWLFRRVSA
ncbi:BRO family protein (plasmid) [Azospirillum sp. HJ39]|uniref:BRO-N domain-containing protein n=1 Tax=Azospirillum sp. HJ39 TaxID=3159496 RepID=UPI0035586F1C